MELVLRGSEYSSFLTCRKQWFYSWYEQIEPKRPDGKLFFGTAFHKWLENYYNSKCNKLQADLETSVWLNEQNTDAMEQTDIDDLMNLLRGVAEHYDRVYNDLDKEFNVLGTEVEFVVKLDEDLYYTGTIDLVYELDGKVRFMDHKTVSSLTTYEEKSKMDRQISRYWWALEKIAAGIGRIKGSIIEDGVKKDLWVRWTDLEGKEVEGFDYNLIAKDFPKAPEVLKKGGLSQNKAQKTNHYLYWNKLISLGLSPADYTDFLEFLKSKPEQFLKRVNVLRNEQEKESAMWEFVYTAADIHDVKLALQEHPQRVEELTYRNIGEHCSYMCAFRSLCQTTIEGGNVSLVKNMGYKKKEEK